MELLTLDHMVLYSRLLFQRAENLFEFGFDEVSLGPNRILRGDSSFKFTSNIYTVWNK